MQQTRLNLLFDAGWSRFTRFFRNPWRRFALLFISFLMGNIFGPFISTSLGQVTAWDPVVAAIFLLFCELVDRLYYHRRKKGNNPSPQAIEAITPFNENTVPTTTELLLEMLNLFKIGFVYGLFLEALKLAS